MAFFKDLTKKITEGVQDASEKASELVEVQKLNSAIKKEKSAIDEVNQQIGEKIFALYQSGESLPDMFSADFQTITNHLQTINGLEANIREIKGEPPIEAPPQPQVAVPAAPPAPVTEAPAAEGSAEGQPAAAANFCPECGSKLTEGQPFCGECGTKVQ